MQPQKQWQKPLCTKKHREPLDSYEILKLKMKQPRISAREIADTLGYDIKRVYDLSERYFHKDRVQAFQEYEMQQLAPQIIHHTSKQLQRLQEREEKQSAIASNHEYIVAKLQKKYIQELQEDRLPSHDVASEYKIQHEQMDRHKELESRSTLNYAKILEALQHEGDAGVESITAISTFVDSLHALREEE